VKRALNQKDDEPRTGPCSGGICSGQKSNLLCKRNIDNAVVPSCFIGKTEEDEEDEGTKDCEVAGELNASHHWLILVPDNKRDLVHVREVVVDI